MKGYLKNPTATQEAFKDGWFHSGDLGIIDPDGYIALKDRSKDIIISGGENISSIESRTPYMRIRTFWKPRWSLDLMRSGGRRRALLFWFEAMRH